MFALSPLLHQHRQGALVSARPLDAGAPLQLTQLPLTSPSRNFSSLQVSFSPISKLPKLCTLDALELKYLSPSVGSFKDLMIFQIPPPKKRLFSNTKVALRSKYSTQTNETVMKCCFRKPVIFSSNVLVTCHSHISSGTVAIPYQSHAGLLVQNTGSWETLSSPASRSAEPRRAPPAIAHVSPTRAPAWQGRGAPGSERFVATSHPQV